MKRKRSRMMGEARRTPATLSILSLSKDGTGCAAVIAPSDCEIL